MSSISRTFWDNCEHSVCPGSIALIYKARLYHHTPGIVHGVVFDPLSADAYVIPKNSGQVEAILNDPQLPVNVMVHVPSNIDFPHVPQGRGSIYNPY
jgi:hypothetical protein